MTLITREACGFADGAAVLSYTFDDAFNPPIVTEIRLDNNDPSQATFNVQLKDRTTGDDIPGASFTHTYSPGADQIFDRNAIRQRFGGDIRMVDSISTKDGSHGWALPYDYRCWTS